MKLSRRQLRKLINEESRILEMLGLYKAPSGSRKDDKTLELLLKRLQELENRVKELEAKGSDR